MSGTRINRRLAAILAMDVAGYTRHMEADEAGTLDALRAARAQVIDPRIEEFGGRIVKSTGDGLLAEFGSAVAALECATAIQDGMAAQSAASPDARQLQFRIGLNIGEIVVEGGDIFGDGVNVAARLEQIASPGGILVSQALSEQVKGKTKVTLNDLGPRYLKNLSQPVRVFEVVGSGSGAPSRARAAEGGRGSSLTAGGDKQSIRFCPSADGTTIAYATAGAGPPVVKVANWLTHLEFDRQSPIWRHLFDAIEGDHTLVRYDQRGNGLSDWNATDYSLEANVADLEAVVDAARLDRFALLGLSQGGPISIAYTAKHPDRVTHLVMHGAFALGWRGRADPEEIKRREAMLAVVEAGWGATTSAFHQVFSSLFVPDGNPEQISWWIDLQRKCTAPATAARLMDAQSRFDVRPMLPMIAAPTLVTHSRGDLVQPFEAGRRIASGIRGARFVPLESVNHIILEQEPEWPRFRDEIRAFLAQPPGSG